tara:strand:- start:2092 stop:2217 length:126 start_codon:yes stop_codon:yes gene_type:complete
MSAVNFALGLRQIPMRVMSFQIVEVVEKSDGQSEVLANEVV